MSEIIKHECGIVQLRLRKPLHYYEQKYGDAGWPLRKLYLMMEKQHNRGQEGAGLAVVKVDAEVGEEYIFRERALGSGAIAEIFAKVHAARKAAAHRPSPSKGEMSCAKFQPAAGGGDGLRISDEIRPSLPFDGELMLGHLRYSTQGKEGTSFVHPFLRRSNWRCRNLLLAGNFSMTNTDEILDAIVKEGQHPRNNADTFILLEQLGAMLDAEEVGKVDIVGLLKKASATWDGGYIISGVTGDGVGFTIRDPWGIRSAHYYVDDEVAVVASERAVIQTVMDLSIDQVKELAPGEAIVFDREGCVKLWQINEARDPRPCSFERIYFSRGTDADIYRERKLLGKLLVPEILAEVDYDIDHSVFSFIPNTAEVAWFGMMEGLEEYNDERKVRRILERGVGVTPEEIREIVGHKVRGEKLAVKDIKLRTFIAEGDRRNELATHVYDITYGTIVEGEDYAVVIDDSIVRGTTLKKSIIKILGRLKPKKIVVVSSSPQVRYPDCYGIDMSRMEEFIAFLAAVELLRESGRESVLREVYRDCCDRPYETNHVKRIYEPFTYEEVSRKIAEMVTPDGLGCEVGVVYQTVEKLREACPGNDGDWYFSGDYPTAGGIRIVNRAYINWYENSYGKQ